MPGSAACRRGGEHLILFSASDACMRDDHIVVPADRVVSNTVEEHDYALAQIGQVLKGDVAERQDRSVTD
ncbi:MAG: hypothetical protein M3545_10785 [Acidobacteriota bacterium]|nr:hypothetical protein [Acidobacteriota bacterium]